MIDVRLKRTDLPTQNLEATFARMRAEREREAADEIARGEEAARRSVPRLTAHRSRSFPRLKSRPRLPGARQMRGAMRSLPMHSGRIRSSSTSTALSGLTNWR